MFNKLTTILAFLFTSLVLITSAHANDAEEKVEQILTANKAPAGIVFEIVTGEATALEWALPEVQNHIKKLRKQYPDLEIAVVTHGREQFALQTNKNKKFKTVHTITQQLATESNVPLHVCGTHASWRNVTEEDFPDYVDVAAAGPATINDYLALGYILIVIDDS